MKYMGIGMSDNDNTNIYCQITFPVPMREPPSTLDQAGASNYNVRRDTTQTCTGNPLQMVVDQSLVLE